MLDFLRGRGLTVRLRQPADEYWDRRFGVRTFGYNPGWGEHGSPAWLSPHVPISYRDVFEALRTAGLGPDSVFVDLGCGLGRALFAAAHLGAGTVVGVELVPWLAAGAEANRRRSRFRTHDIRIVEANALDHPLGDATHVYLFHAFGPDVIVPLFEKARAERKAAGIRRPLRLIYANPVHEDAVAALGWFRPLTRLPARAQRLNGGKHYDCAIWESTDQDR